VISAPHATPVSLGAEGFVRQVNPLDLPEWDKWLASSPSASFFHGSAWARVLHDTYGFNPLYFTNGESGISRMLLPLMEVDSPLTGKRGISLPFTDECSPICGDSASFQSLFDAANIFGKSRGWSYLECRGAKQLLGDAHPSTSFFGHQLDLLPNSSEQFLRLGSSTRRAVRKAEQSGLTIEFSQTLESVKIFYDLLRRTRKRHGLPPQPFSFFVNIHRHILSVNQGNIVVARRGDLPVAAAIFFNFGRTALFKFAASDEAFHSLRVNNFVMWNAIKRYAENGFDLMDFGRTSLFNGGLRRFKLGWGTRERPIDYFKYDCAVDSFVISRDESAGWYNRVFRMMPIYLSKLAGAALYKHAA
jgi:Acetyltransferase (GNAT) domain